MYNIDLRSLQCQTMEVSSNVLSPCCASRRLGRLRSKKHDGHETQTHRVNGTQSGNVVVEATELPEPKVKVLLTSQSKHVSEIRMWPQVEGKKGFYTAEGQWNLLGGYSEEARNPAAPNIRIGCGGRI